MYRILLAAFLAWALSSPAFCAAADVALSGQGRSVSGAGAVPAAGFVPGAAPGSAPLGIGGLNLSLDPALGKGILPLPTPAAAPNALPAPAALLQAKPGPAASAVAPDRPSHAAYLAEAKSPTSSIAAKPPAAPAAGISVPDPASIALPRAEAVASPSRLRQPPGPAAAGKQDRPGAFKSLSALSERLRRRTEGLSAFGHLERAFSGASENARPDDTSSPGKAEPDHPLPPAVREKAERLARQEGLGAVFSEIGAGKEVSRALYAIPGQRIIRAALSPYSREASDDRYSSLPGGRTSEDYTSLERLRQQLDGEYAGMNLPPDRRRAAFALTARTSWGNGHAWMGVRVQEAPGRPPTDIFLHVRMLQDHSREQKTALGILGINLLSAAAESRSAAKDLIQELRTGLAPGELEVDFISIKTPDGKEAAGVEGNLELLRQGFTRQVLLDPSGVPFAPESRRKALARWSLVRPEGVLAVVSPVEPAQDETVVARVRTLAEHGSSREAADGAWTLIVDDVSGAPADFEKRLYPAPRQRAAREVSLERKPGEDALAYKVRLLNQAAWIKGTFADIGGRQAVAMRFFDAGNTHALFQSLSFPSRGAARSRYGRKARLKGAKLVGALISIERALLQRHPMPRHAKFVAATSVERRGEDLAGTLGVWLEARRGGPETRAILSFTFKGGTPRERDKALEALAVGLMYACAFPEESPGPEAAALSMKEGVPAPVTLEVTVLEAAGPIAASFGAN